MINRDNQTDETEEIKTQIANILYEKGFQNVKVTGGIMTESSFPTFGELQPGQWTGTAHQTARFSVNAEYDADKVPFDDKHSFKKKVDNELTRLKKSRENILALKNRLENISDPIRMEFQGKTLPIDVIGAFEQLEVLISDLQKASEQMLNEIVPEDKIFESK